MKKIFIYYSFTGNGDEVAKILEEKEFEIRKVVEKKKMPKSFFFSILGGGFRAGLGIKGKLVDYDNDVSSYEEIIIGSPIWNGRFPPAINSVLAKTNLDNKKVSFILYSGSGEGPKAYNRICKEFPSANTIFLQEPKKHREELDKLNNI